MNETTTIKGEIEAWSEKINDFNRNNRGSRGLKVEGNWHNLIGNKEDLGKIDQEFPKGTLVKFNEKETVKNGTSYFDIVGDLEKIEKEEAYPENKTSENLPKPTNSSDRGRDIKLMACFKAAVEVSKIIFTDNKIPEQVRDFIIKETEIFYKELDTIKEKLQRDLKW